MSERENLRAWLEIDGLRICRDVTIDRGPNKGTVQPRHLTSISPTGWLEWVDHSEGAVVPIARVTEDYA